ncbi:transferrin receptor 1a [Thalassophryne amazonica]|uniref:transferrin receptor 1a n=1 Tax=Thalassophryne amazonica TaxID=390379 RepID=UPI001471A216|nr:transferrin receptor 1a [Thalassophryne amazonica]XP_034040014.1 transferrin receptor 1a [Thalassophryne amazonica]XP_034040015.1 transferrin receptor 1a [Thalassophryne amazonica]
MDQARSAISKIFNGEPHLYTRFSLTQNMEGDNSQVEMKLSSDVEEEVEGNGVGENLNHHSGCQSYMSQKFSHSPKTICFSAVGICAIFILGYFIGYLVQQKGVVSPSCAASTLPFDEFLHQPSIETGAAPLMEWADVKKLLAQKLSAQSFDATFSEFSSNNHRAGSSGDEDLAEKVINRFKKYGMKTWTEEHFIKVQDPPLSAYNKIIFKGKEDRPVGFLSYSANGTAEGAVLYAHYGREIDFRELYDRRHNLNGRVMLVRAGMISFAEKVANAAKVNASAVLIYSDPVDLNIGGSTELYGHVHLGSGDPYTPGFPSFNHTQFPPVKSSGLPSIVAQTITADMAYNILRQLGGQLPPLRWGISMRLGDESDVITVTVNNVVTEKRIINVFGVIKGFVDADRYMVLGAQRDAWGPGFASSTVGTSMLVELARSISDMVKNDGFKPRRSIVFASWSAGEYGSVGATEWLEGYLSSLSMKVFSYINLDGVVGGQSRFKVAASPLMFGLVESTLKEVNTPNSAVLTLYSQFGKSANWEKTILESFRLESAAYPFLAFSGIPSVSFRFTTSMSEEVSDDYPFYGTMLDTREKLNSFTSNQAPALAVTAARFAGHMTLRLVHDHLLRMGLQKYATVISSHVLDISRKFRVVQKLQPQLLPRDLTVQWLMSASGSFNRASRGLAEDIEDSDLEDIELCRVINDRIMAVERNFLSPYVSPTQNPFRHILLGSGPHTLKALTSHLEDLKTDDPSTDTDLFRNQFAMATWTIQGCANSVAGDIWSLDNEI